MKQHAQGISRLILIAMFASLLLLMVPSASSAASLDGHSFVRGIFDSFVERLCDAQGAHGNRIRFFSLERCAPPPPPPATLTLMKTVVNDDGGTAVASDFQAKIDGADVPWGVAQTVSAGAHTASEMSLANYTASDWGGDCAADGTVTIAPGEHKTCSIENNDVPPPPAPGHLIVDKVTQPGGSLAEFTVHASGSGAITGGGDGMVTDATSKDYEVEAGTYAVTEDPMDGWTVVSNTCEDVVVAPGATEMCTITNAKLPTLTLGKTVTNDDGGTAVANDFQAKIDGADVPWDVPQIVSIGAHTASETTLAGYTASDWGGDCAADGTITLAAGDEKTCSIENDDNPPPPGNVVISEIMYDPAGADEDHEWIEIKNETGGPVDLTDWKFFEDGTNHGLALAFGVIIIPDGGFAVISEDAAQFQVDYPDFAATLFDSSFDLSNTGETIAIKNAGGAIVDEVTYSSDQGASDDGNSLQKSGGVWTAAAPTPGS